MPSGARPRAPQSAGLCQQHSISAGAARAEVVAAGGREDPPAPLDVTQAEPTRGEGAGDDDEWGMLNSESIAANASVMRHLARVTIRKYIACKVAQHPQ